MVYKSDAGDFHILSIDFDIWLPKGAGEMSFLSNLFSSSAETRENPRKSTLKTRYYRNDQRKILEVIQSMPKEIPQLKLLHISQNQNEATYEYKSGLFTHDVVLTLFKITPVKSAIDIYSSSRAGVPDFGANEKIILKIYSFLNSKLSAADK